MSDMSDDRQQEETFAERWADATGQSIAIALQSMKESLDRIRGRDG